MRKRSFRRRRFSCRMGALMSRCYARWGRVRNAENSAESALDAPAPPVMQQLPCGVVARDPAHPPAGMRPGAAKVQIAQRHAVIGVSQDRAGAEELVEGELAVEDVAAEQPELTLEIER